MKNTGDINTAPIVTYARHRIQSDGRGVTTLVCFHGCPLRCKMCINPFTFDPDTKYRILYPTELYNELKIDNLYFLATEGGVTFGGGEPLLYPDFLAEFRNICGNDWHLCAETSLNVPWEHVEKAAKAIDCFIIDIKDLDPRIYKEYTGKDNTLVKENLKKLLSFYSPDNIIIRVPLITNYNTEEDQKNSIGVLKDMGIKNFDKFDYITPKNRDSLFKK